MNESKPLTDKFALVTGGAHRVGKAIALALADAGANLVIHYHRSAESAAETAKAVRALGRQVLTVGADLGEVTGIEQLFEVVDEQVGRLDILVNSASVFQPVEFMTMSAAQWDRTLAVNLRAPAFCAQAAARLMARGGGGHIVNIADVIGLRPWQRYPHHSVSKAGVVMLTQVLAMSLAPHIRVNAVAPGPVLKPADMSEERWQMIGAGSLLGRPGQPSDVADAVVFLVSSDYITGEVLVVDGGTRFVG